MKRDTGIEPVTYRWIVVAVSIPKLVSVTGLEPATSSSPNLRSSNLSYTEIIKQDDVSKAGSRTHDTPPTGLACKKWLQKFYVAVVIL